MKTTLKTLFFGLISLLALSSCSNDELDQQKLNESISTAITEYLNKSDSATTKQISEPININIRDVSSSDDLAGHYITAIVFIALIIPFLAVVCIIFIIVRFMFKKVQSRNRIIEKAIENNAQLPEDFFKSHIEKSRLESALVWIAWGIGIALVLLVLNINNEENAQNTYILGLIPFLVGIAKLITYFVEDHNNNQDENA